MNQLGDIVVFTSTGTAPGSAQPIYVWKFWDASVQVSEQNQGTVSKRLNMGGNPAEGVGPPYVLPYRCDICDREGTVVRVVPSTIDVNNPPTLYTPPAVNPNNQAFPFQTEVTVQAYDLESAGVAFFWYYGTNAIGGQDVTTGPVAVAGTYFGTLIGSNRDLYTNALSTTVHSSGTVLTCKVVDGDGGTRLVSVPVQGYDPNAPQFSIAARQGGVTVDATTLPDAVIAPGQTVNLSTYAFDSTPGSILFTWYLYGTNGWNQPGLPIISNGVTSAMERGFHNDFVVSIANETATGPRTAVARATNLVTQRFSEAEISINLVQNATPQVQSVGMYSAVTEQAIETVTKLALPARTLVRFTGTATDANLDTLYYRWDWTTPGIPANYAMYGRECFVDVTTWPAGAYTTLGFVTAYDKYEAASTPFPIPQVTINP